ncbi:cyclic nucleotide-binding protein [Methylobacterium radiotolerans]|uniref:Crp/Fnr family transcriptional regulator n=1 Tax=Methylobacterium TaxID=407 RepID=UPI002F331F04
MPNFLIAKLQQFTSLSDADRVALHEVTDRRRQVAAREDIVREGEPHGPIRAILDGWACRYRRLEDGRRQVSALLLPGDLCDTHVNVLRAMDHSIGALTPVTVAEIPRDRLDRLVGYHPRVGRALWREMLAAASIQREWTVNMARREGVERLGHLFCALFHRLRAAGLTRDRDYGLPLRQSDLADASSLTDVHVKRCLQALRDRDLITSRSRRLTILDLPALQRASGFSPDYCHVGRRDSVRAADPILSLPPETGRHEASHRHPAR